MKKNINILIVEDESITALAIVEELEKMGYFSIDTAINYTKAIYCIKRKEPDLILLDVDLKEEKRGIDIALSKEVFNKIPIIYITSYTDYQTRREIIETNPNSYLSKPLKYEELAVAISLVLKSKMGIVNIGYEFSYDLECRNLFKKKEFVKLSPKEKVLLEQLIVAKGRDVSFQILESEIWKDEGCSDNALRTLVGSLRKRLNSKMIVSVLGFGYKLDVPKEI